jgi:Flp pilus assembly protein CpaB
VLTRKWPTAAKVYLALAILGGIAAFALVRGYAARLEELRPALGDPRSVVVATRDIARGSELTHDALEIRKVPSTFVPPGSVSLDAAIGRIVTSDLAEGEAVTETRLAERGTGRLAALVPAGLRAVTIEAVVPPGAVAPGDRVDVLATFGDGAPHVETVAEGLEVLLVVRPPGGGLGASGAAGSQLVLLTAPDVAERLAFARSFAELSVAIAGEVE